MEYYDAQTYKSSIHIIGCGAIGSNVAELITRMGFSTIDIYDFDLVEAKNIHNQNFTAAHIGHEKQDCVEELCKKINPDIIITKHGKLEAPYKISGGIIILAVDNIDLRREIVAANKMNPNIICMLDFRMRLTDAQYYFAANPGHYETLLETMDFTHEEAQEETQLSACHVEMNVVYIVKMITAIGVANLITFLKGRVPNNLILADAAAMALDAFTWKPRKIEYKSEIELMLEQLSLTAERSEA